LHDKQRYTEIKINTFRLLLKIGYDRASAKSASRVIETIYRKADLAEKYMHSDSAKENFLYDEMVKACDNLDRMLGRKMNSKNELFWWKAIRHRNIILASFYLFNDQLSKFGYTRFISAAKATVFLFNAGKAHDNKNWDLCKAETKNMWSIVKSRGIYKYLEF
jgi:hypothetical protein